MAFDRHGNLIWGSAALTPGRKAYEADVVARPLYHDGTPRRAWHELSEIARKSWELNPTPRWSAQ